LGLKTVGEDNNSGDERTYALLDFQSESQKQRIFYPIKCRLEIYYTSCPDYSKGIPSEQIWTSIISSFFLLLPDKFFPWI